MAVMLYTAPAFAALGLHWLVPEERLNRVQWAGIFLAFGGVAVAFYRSASPAGETSLSAMLWGDFLGLLAGMSWGATTVVIRSKLSETPAAQTVFSQLITGFCILIVGSAVMGQFSFTPSGIVWASLLYQTLVVSFASFLIWFWLLRIYPASQLGVLSFLTPVFGVIFGVALLGETVTPQFAAGALLILAGILLVSGWQWLKTHLWTPPGRG